MRPDLPVTPNSVGWVYEVYYEAYTQPNIRRTVIDKYKLLMKHYPASLAAGVPHCGIKMSFYHNIDDANDARKWDSDQLEKHFIVNKEGMAFSSEW